MRALSQSLARHLTCSGAVVLGIMACHVLAIPAAAAGRDDDDVFPEIQKALAAATKAFEENRKEDGLLELEKARALAQTFKPTAQNYIREAYLWLYATKPEEPTAAINAAKKALALPGADAAEAYYVLGLVAMEFEGNAQRAIDNFTKALETKKEASPEKAAWSLNAANKLWHVCERTKQFQLAEKLFKRLTEKEPKNANYHFFLGLAYFFGADYLDAATALGKAVDALPNDDQLHLYYTAALKKNPGGLSEAVRVYEELCQKHSDPAVLIWLADLYLEVGNKDRALPLLLKAKNASTLDFHARDRLAKNLFKADSPAESAAQFARLWNTRPGNLSKGSEIEILIDYAKALVKAGEVKEGILKLNEALEKQRMYFPQTQEPLDILFELGLAHWELAKKDKTRGTDDAEIYFRKYLTLLEEGAKGQQRFAKDVDIAESLGVLYMQSGQPQKAAKVFHQALDIIKYAVDKDKCPTNRVQFRHVQALYAARDWPRCIAAATEVVGDKEYGWQTRLLLAQAYVANNQGEKAIEQLAALKGSQQWNDEALLTMGQALLKSSPARPAEAVKYIKEAYDKQPDEEKRALEYAQVLRLLNQPGEARALYEKILKKNLRSVQAMAGLGDLEKDLAKATSGQDSLDHYKQAVNHYKEAQSLEPSTELLDKQSAAERGQALAEADIEAQRDRLRMILYTGIVFLAAALPIGFVIYLYRRQWALHCFRQVCELEADLLQLIRDRVRSRWFGEWQRLGEEPFRGRLDYKTLRMRAEKQGAKDVLAVANFGHLVAIVDAGWEALGFDELCAPEFGNPKEMVVAHLSYVSSCRACLAHVGKLEELTARHLSRDPQSDGTLKAYLPKHLHRQVKTSLQLIRSRFNLRPPPDELPVLSPVRPPQGQTRRPQ
jgi:tetratricopeptide (TPR) repeat protein